jgi:hypothetical protein
MRWANWALAAGSALFLLTGEAHADTSSDREHAEPSHPWFDAAASARQGMMLPSVLPTDTELASRATATTWAGYDSARSSFVLRTFADATVYKRLALRVGMSYLPDSLNQSAQPSFGARVQILRQSKHGFDLGAGGFYRMERFTSEEGLIQALLTGALHVGKTALFANLAFGMDAEGDDTEGEVLLAVLRSLNHSLQLGIEGRARFSLASDDPKRREEPVESADASLAPTLSYALGPIALLAQAGASARHAEHWRVGPLAMGGLAASF